MRELLVFVFATCGFAVAQTAGPEFEVATIKITNPAPGQPRKLGMHGGPGTSDPVQFNWYNCRLGELLSEAYGIALPRLSGPAGLRTTTYDIAAKVPRGATKDQLPAMLRSLLIERLKLASHWEQREMAAYILYVAKSGSKLKPFVIAPAPSDERVPIWALGLDKDGYLNLPPDFRGSVTDGSGKYRYRFSGQTMHGFADWLADQFMKPVFDETGLAGTYNIDLKWQAIADGAGDGSSGPPSRIDLTIPLVEAVQSQLGLRLESKKRMVDVLVIDHVEKLPLQD